MPISGAVLFAVSTSRSSTVFVVFLPGLVYDLQRVAICSSPEPMAASEANMLFVQAPFDEAHLIDYLALISAPSEVRRCFV